MGNLLKEFWVDDLGCFYVLRWCRSSHFSLIGTKRTCSENKQNWRTSNDVLILSTKSHVEREKRLERVGEEKTEEEEQEEEEEEEEGEEG
ncbi:hypothetical protein HZH68_005527 [Vespula germanica]|uniref:Uncharacterized protein n=1 Tax=Vespula germanica TaxID=30212 RepID=A0A834NG34_VESGE|nr:hypothetical protein HZH68_005527 [Vespula germanica]